ncbi:MAG: GNVR domain-containing protein, partial [Thermodesulfobacteriota bacterium]|nr:GNVR domain-containing protein [Thermodesulfobacteriota bacterium]
VIGFLFLVSVASAAVISLLMTPIFQAKATLMPVESSQGRFSAALGTLQNLPFVGGAVGGAWGKTATDKLTSILNSRTVAEDVIKSLKLMPVLFLEYWDEKNSRWKTNKPPTLQDTVRLLQKSMVKIADDRKGLLSISVEYKDPKLAADIANEYIIALQRFLHSSAISLAKRNRIFLERQIEVTKHDLKETEESLKNFQTSKKIAHLDAQAEAAIKTLAELKTQIITREVHLNAFREFATEEHPDVKRLADELRELRQQLKRLEEGTKNPEKKESIGAFITLSEAPTIGLEYGRLRRDAMVQQKVFELLTQQLELAKIEEAKDDITFQVIDQAIPPEKRIKPKRTLNVLLAGVVSLFLGVFLAFFLEYLSRQKYYSQPNDPITQ